MNRRWRLNLLVGIIFLACCIAASRIANLISEHWISNLLQESLVIIGWVALWEPVSYFLYGWTENADLFTSCLRLRNAHVTAAAGRQ